MNYRRLYQKHYGIVIPALFDIHHIDRNRANNDIKNLLLLPKKTHQILHFCGGIIEQVIMSGKTPFSLNNPQVLGFMVGHIKSYADIFEDLYFWSSVKMFEDMQFGGFGEYSYNRFR